MNLIYYLFPEFDENIDDSETDSRYSIGTNISKSSSVSTHIIPD